MHAVLKLLSPFKETEIAYWFFIKKLRLKITQADFIRQLRSHPDYPSLLSFSDLLTGIGVENRALLLPVEEFKEMKTPFLVYLKLQNNKTASFGIVEDAGDDFIVLYNAENSRETVSYASFKDRYNGVALLVTSVQQSTDSDFTRKKKIEQREKFFRALTLITAPLLTLLYFVISFINSRPVDASLKSLYSILSLLGWGVSLLLLVYEIDKYNPSVSQICQKSKVINCSAVLNSKGAKIFGISWSVLGFSYFFSIWLTQIIIDIYSKSFFCLLSVISIAAVCYSVFSIYYQWKVTKQWCTLCLSVQAILILQAIVVLFMKPFDNLSVSYIDVIAITSIAFIVFGTTRFLIPVFKRVKEGYYKTRELNQLKFNPYIFNTLLKQQPAYLGDIGYLGVSIGASNSKYNVLKVCNPYCGPCSQAHTVLDALMETNPNISVKIIFTVTNNEGDPRSKPVRHFLSRQQKGNGKELKEVLDGWYNAEKKDYEGFASKYPISEEENYEDEISKMNEWCNLNNITGTPTIYINGYKLPDTYNVNDLKYILQN